MRSPSSWKNLETLAPTETKRRFMQGVGTIASDGDCAGWIVWRLVSRQDDGQYPVDEFDKFDIHNDGGSVWRALQNAATRYASFPAP